jgi:hypothetical protein
MNYRVLKIAAAAVVCLPLLMGCAARGPQVPIINPQLIDEKAARDQFISKYVDVVTKANREGFEMATAICRRIQSGEVVPAGVKSSENGRHFVYMFKEKGGAGAAGNVYTLISFSFHPGADMFRSCDESGRCDVYVRNGIFRFGRSDVAVNGEPGVTDAGISIKYIDNRSFTYNLLFSYRADMKREGEELIAITLSAFPVVSYY